ncbi:hypothetical protein FHT40_004143 [Mycolicibacterium sp. BK556]|uniref:hypothetical protein n=1 Tax=unclassified Mycolicibacterium TaxID=2636767 RepID=UPI001612BFE6|nr:MULTISPECIES: hypothetical protein [unclassified Mycolicibacterium]MBB3604465.1 hypothetical protein [Mycolicibacterium sp. BK556]MBB3634822.1 hypothetical protein [Mycolicibacterium sp. BK607]
MTYPDVAQMILGRRKKMLTLTVAQLRGVGEDDPAVKKVVTVWSAVVPPLGFAGPERMQV